MVFFFFDVVCCPNVIFYILFLLMTFHLHLFFLLSNIQHFHAKSLLWASSSLASILVAATFLSYLHNLLANLLYLSHPGTYFASYLQLPVSVSVSIKGSTKLSCTFASCYMYTLILARY